MLVNGFKSFCSNIGNVNLFGLCPIVHKIHLLIEKSGGWVRNLLMNFFDFF